jgi:hypothetical protein
MNHKHLILFNIFIVTLFAGCAQLPPTPQDIQAKQFQPVADKAVIYIVRTPVDGQVAAALSIPGGMISTHPGTYYRLEVAPGRHRIEGAGATTAAVTLQAEAGRIYFVEQTATGGPRDGIQTMSLHRVDETRGRRLVNDATLL